MREFISFSTFDKLLTIDGMMDELFTNLCSRLRCVYASVCVWDVLLLCKLLFWGKSRRFSHSLTCNQQLGPHAQLPGVPRMYIFYVFIAALCIKTIVVLNSLWGEKVNMLDDVSPFRTPNVKMKNWKFQPICKAIPAVTALLQTDAGKLQFGTVRTIKR